MPTRRKPGPVITIDPAKWDAIWDEAYFRMLELNASPTSALVRDLSDTLFFQSHPEKRN
jgi:hypothetical protein